LQSNDEKKQTGILLARGAVRLLFDLGYAPLTEFTLASGRRVDVFGVGKHASLVAVEVKSSRNDFLSDQKWQSYLEYCDQFYFAVPESFPTELIPSHQGFMRVDQFSGSLIRQAKPSPVSAARRKAILTRFARTAASRLNLLNDPLRKL